MKDQKDQGSVSIEASLVMPAFLLAMLMLFFAFQSVLAEAQVYEAAAETVEYMSELASIDACDVSVAYLSFPRYVDNEELLNQYVRRGIQGVGFLGSEMSTEDEHVVLRVGYDMKYMGNRSFTIKKRTYTGANWQQQDKMQEGGADTYVYVTENQEVYHLTRQCTYLALQIQISSLEYATKQGYEACAFCGKNVVGNKVYVTSEGERYHSNLKCSGLKRTIYRKKKTEVQGLGVCSRCGREA